VDNSGTIDLLELSSLVRTAQAFVRYDKDGSGAIDIDEMRDALRKLGVKAGALEEAQLFRKYDCDGSGEIELFEFATLVRDLQLYAQFDTNADGGIDVDELHDALQQLNIQCSKEQTRSIFKAATGGTGVAGLVTGAVAADVESLSMQVFTSKCCAALRRHRPLPAPSPV
jgi:Ca2+-binding EF-hand superfamily protein